MYDADDLIDEIRWYEQKMASQDNESKSPFVDINDSVILEWLDRLNVINEKLKTISDELNDLGLPKGPQRFDKILRPETSSFLMNKGIFGRDKEREEVMKLLGVPTNRTRTHAKRKRENSEVHASTSKSAETRISCLPVLPIVGIGGVGKTTLAQYICDDQQVKSHFDFIIWICVSDDFDVERLTKEAIQSSSSIEAPTGNLDRLQRVLCENVSNKRFLIVLDDLWDDALKERGQRWKKFCAPLTNLLQGSAMLITTRSPEVAREVQTMNHFTLDGLDDVSFWNFFKRCAFQHKNSYYDSELERIGRSILPKLKGSPLAAITLGGILSTNPEPTYWDQILRSELWDLKQEETDILPALRLSYIYLPFHLKRCFSFCAVYPKDHIFEKIILAEIWVAEGFVEPKDGNSLLGTGCQYFEDLVRRSFFQCVRGKYVIHDLMHDMAQLVSKHECFIIKDMSDFEKVPENVRRLMILNNKNFDCSSLLSLCKHTKLRTILCSKSLGKTTSVMDRWCSALGHIRVFSCASLKEIPKSIGNLKHLRYLQISRKCQFKSLPPEICCLYNLQFFYARKCVVESLPSDFGKLINLQIYQSERFEYHRMNRLRLGACWEREVGLMKNMSQFCGDLILSNLGVLIKDLATEMELNKKKYVGNLALQWNRKISQEHNAMEVIQVLHPPTSLRYLKLVNYPGEYLPCWFQRQNGCNGTIDLNKIPGVIVDSNNGCISVFPFLTDVDISGCDNLSSLDQFLQAAYLPSLKRLKISNCRKVAALPTQRFSELRCLEELTVYDCPIFDGSGTLSMPTLKKFYLRSSGTLTSNIECRSLTHFSLCSSYEKTSIPIQVWTSNLPALQKLEINWCESLTFMGESESSDFTNLSLQGGTSTIRPFSCLTVLRIDRCQKLSTIDDLLTREYLPAIEMIAVCDCEELLSLPGERFGGFPFLKELMIYGCQRINWQRGLVLPSSLQNLHLGDCGDFSAWFPSCLENLTSLVSLNLSSCPGITSIPDVMWSSNLSSIRTLKIVNCPDLVSIGRKKTIAKIMYVDIQDCPKWKKSERPVRRRR